MVSYTTPQVTPIYDVRASRHCYCVQGGTVEESSRTTLTHSDLRHHNLGCHNNGDVNNSRPFTASATSLTCVM
ncbi:hypothetical protein J6590_009913 [Homalodisca vitripennis]|nr:hypothetical protein J6590_009913 [Homalodisca vitripennis]